MFEWKFNKADLLFIAIPVLVLLYLLVNNLFFLFSNYFYMRLLSSLIAWKIFINPMLNGTNVWIGVYSFPNDNEPFNMLIRLTSFWLGICGYFYCLNDVISSVMLTL